MAMSVGSVTVASDGTWTGTGAVKAYMDLVQPWMLSQLPPAPPPYDTAHNGPPLTDDVVFGISTAAAGMATMLGTVLVGYLTANEQAIIPKDSLGSGIPSTEVDVNVK